MMVKSLIDEYAMERETKEEEVQIINDSSISWHLSLFPFINQLFQGVSLSLD